MSQKVIVTQAELAGFKDALDVIASNLNTHVNHSLSKAHGIELVNGYTDDESNDRTTYQNSNGNIIGTFFVRFVVNGVIYYAPGNTSVLAGQTESTGSLDVNPDITEGLTIPSAASLITEYGSIELEQAESVNDLLLEHTRQNHDLVHSEGGEMSAIAKVTYDSAGYVVGRYVVKMIVNGVEYEVPCDTRLGGPPQTPRIDIIPASKIANNIPSPYGITIVPTVLGGTKPITFSWEYYNNGSWATLPLGVPTLVPFTSNVSNAVLTTFTDADTGNVLFTSGAPGGNNFDYIRLRLTATNEVGSVTTDPNGNILYFDFQVQDKAPCCWFCTQANITRRLTPEEWAAVGEVEQELFRRCRRGVVWYLRQGDTLLQRMLAGGVDQEWFTEFVTDLLLIHSLSGLDKAARFYAEKVCQMTDAHWPECAHPGYKARLGYIK